MAAKSTVKVKNLYKQSKKNDNYIRDIIEKVDEAINLAVHHTQCKTVKLHLSTTNENTAGKYNLYDEKNLWYKVEYCIPFQLDRNKVLESIKNYYIDYGYNVDILNHYALMNIHWQVS